MMKFSIIAVMLAMSVPAGAAQQIESPLAKSVEDRRAVLVGGGADFGIIAKSPIEREFGDFGGDTVTSLPDPVVGPNSVGGGPRPPVIPEPETWMLFIIGFGGLGLALRRRRRLVTSD